MTSWSITRNTSLAAREWSRIRLGCTAASVALFAAAVVVLGALAPCTGLAAAVFRFTWGTPVYGLCERVVLGLGTGWISVLATRALTRPPGRARWRT